MALNDRQQAFLDELKKQPRGQRNATEAALRAGYAKSRARQTGSRLMCQNGDIKKALEEWDAKRTEEAEKEAGLTSDWVLSRIMTIVDDPETSRKDQLKGLEMLGKYLDMFAGKKEQEAQRIEVVYDDPEMEAWGE